MQIGERLKEQREAKNLSLDDIQAETKIQKRYLNAIEQDDFQALPGKFYARAFIKEYAQVVGLDSEELLKGFDEQDIEPEEPAVQYTRMDHSKQGKGMKNSSFWSSLPTIIVIILVIGILFVAWVLMQQKSDTIDDNNLNNQTENDEIIRDKPNNDKNADNAANTIDNEDQNDESNKADNNEKEDNDDNDENKEDEFEVVEEGTGSFPESKLDFTYGGDKAEVEFDVSEDTYIEMQGDDENYLAEVLTADGDSETYDVSDHDEIFIKVGNAKGTTITINGVELEYPVDTDTVTQKLRVNLKKAE